MKQYSYLHYVLLWRGIGIALEQALGLIRTAIQEGLEGQVRRAEHLAEVIEDAPIHRS